MESLVKDRYSKDEIKEFFEMLYFEELEKKSLYIHTLFTQNKQTLALAESCTGGLLSYFLTIKEGASVFFLGSVVGYSYLAKMRSLDIPSKVLKEKGAVNQSVCRLMAQGIKKKWDSDWAMAITGVAGPGRMERDPEVGVVFIGVLGPDCDEVAPFLLDKKNRQDIRHQSAIFALDFLQSRIKIGGKIKKEVSYE
ncbi:MAG: CinA family protein [Bdellovibrionales bacterium]|nr:CinA family protein [Bdellovibrionales bacterium]